MPSVITAPPASKSYSKGAQHVTLVRRLSPLGCLSDLRLDQQRSQSRKYLLLADNATRLRAVLRSKTLWSRQRPRDNRANHRTVPRVTQPSVILIFVPHVHTQRVKHKARQPNTHTEHSKRTVFCQSCVLSQSVCLFVCHVWTSRGKCPHDP